MTAKTALVAGASGLVGGHLIEHLSRLGGWRIVGLSRKPAKLDADYRHVAVDLMDPADCAAKLGGLTETTHLFYAALLSPLDRTEEARVNLAMLRNLFEAVEPAARGLQHVQLMHGAKWYGAHLGPYKTPAKEDDPRHMPPNFYYDQHDYLTAKREGKAWRWSTVRPGPICGFAHKHPYDIMTVLGVYAAISKELGMPLKFPGKPGTFSILTHMSDIGVINKLMVWAATTPACADQDFNVTNGDIYRWAHVWPRLARYFGMEAGEPQQIHLATQMADKEPVWRRIVEKHGLDPSPLHEQVSWAFGDFIFNRDWDHILSMTKAYGLGFNERLDTERMLIDRLDDLRRRRIIP